ncbi:MAG: BON domain-containing protein, partial [Cocleimonas sp.]|nr:BON domain-containing protein [Cocleimonas sp.]
MANGHSCCCSALSKGWWWLLTLLGLSLLYFLMFSAKRGTIEEDLHTRTTQQLSVEGADWSSVDIDYRGRDVLLTGTASSELERDNAIKTALGVAGVRIVESNIDVVLLKERSLTANYSHEGGKLVVEGVLSSQDKVDEIFNMLVARLGSDNIVNKLTVDEEYSNKGGTLTLSGSVLNEDALSEVSSVVKSGSSVLGLDLTNNLE